MVFFSSENFAPDINRDLPRQVTLRDGGGDLRDVADLRRKVRGHRVHGFRQVLPDTGDTFYIGLSAEFSFGADFSRHARDFARERIELVDHRIERVFQFENLSPCIDRDFGGKVAAGDSGRYLGDVADLRREVSGHEVDRVGQILPDAAHTSNIRLAAEFTFGPDFARDAGYFAGESVELVDHRVDGVLELENFALRVDGDLCRKVAAGDRRCDLGDVADLRREVSGHEVDRIREVLPNAADAFYHRLTAEFALGTHFSRHARHFGAEGTELIHHGVDGQFQVENLAAHIDCDLSGKVAVRHCRGDLRDVPHLRGEVRSHRIHRVRKILPGTRNALHLRLAAEFAFGTHFSRHTRDFRREGVELIHHGVHHLGGTHELTL